MLLERAHGLAPHDVLDASPRGAEGLKAVDQQNVPHQVPARPLKRHDPYYSLAWPPCPYPPDVVAEEIQRAAERFGADGVDGRGVHRTTSVHAARCQAMARVAESRIGTGRGARGCARTARQQSVKRGAASRAAPQGSLAGSSALSNHFFNTSGAGWDCEASGRLVQQQPG